MVLVTSALSAGVSFTLAASALHKGPAGPQGATGPPGPAGETTVSSEDVLSAIDGDPEAVARSLSGHLDYEEIQQNLDPDPSDVERSVAEVTERIDGLCSDLSLSDAVSSDITSC